MELCLECRACKAECPVGVDVGRFKSEFLADYQRRHGTPLRARLLGRIHDVSRWGSRLAPLSNLVARSAPARWLNEQVFGIDRRRRPPAWSSRTFREQFTGRFESPDGSARAAFLFNDTFTNHYNPGVGMAGATLIAKAGWAPSLAPNVCCGRPLISQGLLEDAHTLADRNTTALFPIAERGQPIVFFEPSCLSAIREDVPALLRGEAQRKARTIAVASVSFEEFLDGAWSPHLSFRTGPATILLHGHCHQKAMGLLPPAKALLARVPGASVVDLNAGCCGMAGSFGYLRDHFEVSRAIGERRLLPAARGLTPASVLVASGVSCRHQVEDFTGARAVHPAEFLHSLLEPS
jgi:Fe-S oxidoreductase